VADSPTPGSAFPIVEFRGVEKVYGSGESEVRALAGVDMRIDAGEFVSIMGSSGSGKSTAMNMIGCLDVPTGGQYLFRGVNVGQLDRDSRAVLRRRFILFVFKGFNLLARTSRRCNLGVPSRRRSRHPKQEKSRCRRHR